MKPFKAFVMLHAFPTNSINVSYSYILSFPTEGVRRPICEILLQYNSQRNKEKKFEQTENGS